MEKLRHPGGVRQSFIPEPPDSRGSIPNHSPALPHCHTHALSSLRPGTVTCASLGVPHPESSVQHGMVHAGVSKGLEWA